MDIQLPNDIPESVFPFPNSGNADQGGEFGALGGD
jgi:hypothetical protein